MRASNDAEKDRQISSELTDDLRQVKQRANLNLALDEQIYKNLQNHERCLTRCYISTVTAASRVFRPDLHRTSVDETIF